MKRGKILVFVSSLFLVVALLTGCKKDKGPKLFGIDSIDNVLYGSQVYYAMGFSFELGDITSTLELPPPDITIHVYKDIDGNIAGKYFNTPQLVESFAEEVSRIILNEFNAAWVKVKLSKPKAVKEAQGVGVVIERAHKLAAVYEKST